MTSNCRPVEACSQGPPLPLPPVSWDCSPTANDQPPIGPHAIHADLLPLQQLHCPPTSIGTPPIDPHATLDDVLPPSQLFDWVTNLRIHKRVDGDRDYKLRVIRCRTCHRKDKTIQIFEQSLCLGFSLNATVDSRKIRTCVQALRTSAHKKRNAPRLCLAHVSRIV